MPRASTRRKSTARRAAQTGAAGPSQGAAARAYQEASTARDYARARAIIEDAVARWPAWSAARVIQAQLLYEHYGQIQAPRAILEAELDRAPNDPNILPLLASICSGAGLMADATRFAERSIAAFPAVADAYQTIQRADPARGPELRAAIERVMATLSITPRQRLVFHATLGRIADREGDRARAIAEYGRANALRPGDYRPDAITRYFDEIRAAYDAETLARLRRCGASDARPSFIVGLPRSGSTLLERILSRHARIDTAGERSEMTTLSETLRLGRRAPPPGAPGGARFMTELTKHEARAIGARYAALVRPALENPAAARWLDKMPGNFILLGFIKTVLPQARLIHARRNAVDVALSCFSESFKTGHTYAQSWPSLAHYIVEQRRLMAHWRAQLGEELLEVAYEDVVDDHERAARRGLDHLGLDWDPNCLTPEESDRPVVTASIAQVRQPVYKSSAGRWRRYRSELTPLFDAWRAMGEDIYREMMAEAEETA